MNAPNDLHDDPKALRRLRRRRQRSPLVLGVFLILVGGGLLSINLGYGIPVELWLYWPMVLIVFGLIGLLMPSQHVTRPGGIWLLGAGLYCQIGLLHLFGLGWGTAWPIFIICWGLSVLFDAPKCSRRDGDKNDPDKVLHET